MDGPCLPGSPQPHEGVNGAARPVRVQRQRLRLKRGTNGKVRVSVRGTGTRTGTGSRSATEVGEWEMGRVGWGGRERGVGSEMGSETGSGDAVRGTGKVHGDRDGGERSGEVSAGGADIDSMSSHQGLVRALNLGRGCGPAIHP